jgi:hypothetical protein
LQFERLSHETDLTDIIPLENTGAFLVQKGSNLEDLYFFNREKATLTPLATEGSPYFDFPVVSHFDPKESVALIAYGGSLFERKHLLIDAQKDQVDIRDISKLFSDKPLSIVGHRDRKNIIFALYKNHVDQLDLAAMSVAPKYLEAIKGFGLSEKWLYLLDAGKDLSRMSWDKERLTTDSEDNPIPKSFLARSRFYKIRALANNMFLFWGDKGDLITTAPPYVIAEEKAVGFEVWEPAQQLLYWTKDHIGIVALHAAKEEEGLLPAQPLHFQPVYDGKHITQCFWAYHGTHVLFKDKDEVFLLELMPDGKHHVEYLFIAQRNSGITYSEKDGTIYYLDPKGFLMKAKIIPEERTDGI